MSAPIRRNAGFSLIELMISASLVLIVMVVVTQVFTTQHRTYVVIDEISEAQQNLRAVSELIERDVRRAGYMVPAQAAVCAFDQSTGPDTLYVSKTDEIRTVFDLEDENLSLTADKGAPVRGRCEHRSAGAVGQPTRRRDALITYVRPSAPCVAPSINGMLASANSGSSSRMRSASAIPRSYSRVKRAWTRRSAR